MYVLSTSPKRISPVIEPSSEQYSPVVLACHKIFILVVRQFHDDMRACVRLDDRVCSGWFTVDQGLRQGCMLALLVFNIFSIFREDYKRGLHTFQDGQRHHERFDASEEENGGRGAGGEKTSGEAVTLLWSIIYADDAGVVLQSLEQLRKIIRVIVVVCAAFGLTVSEAKTEINHHVVTQEGNAEVHRHIQRRGSWPGV